MTTFTRLPEDDSGHVTQLQPRRDKWDLRKQTKKHTSLKDAQTFTDFKIQKFKNVPVSTAAKRRLGCLLPILECLNATPSSAHNPSFLHVGNQQTAAQVAGSLPPMWETHTNFPVLGFSLSQAWFLQAFQESDNSWNSNKVSSKLNAKRTFSPVYSRSLWLAADLNQGTSVGSGITMVKDTMAHYAIVELDLAKGIFLY